MAASLSIRHVRPAVAWCAGLFLVGVLTVRATAGDDQPRPVTDRMVQAILVEDAASGGDRAAAREDAGRRLGRLGLAAMPILFGTLLKDRLPLPVREGEPPLRLNDRKREVILGAFGHLPREPVLLFLRRRLAADGSRNMRYNVLRVLGEIGDSNQVDDLLDVAAPGGKLLTGRIRRSLTHAAERIMRRDARACHAVERVLFGARPIATGALVSALGTAGGSRELVMLDRLLRRTSGHDAVIIASIGQIGRRALKPHDPAVVGHVREFLGADDPQLVREAALACGNLEDYDAITGLTELLEHEDASVRPVAHWALEQITGVSFAARPEPWRTWLKAEKVWFETEAPDLLEALEDSDSAKVGGALQALSIRRFRRDEIAAAITPLLEHDKSVIRVLAGLTLKQLGTTAAVLPLIDALEDSDSRVATSAWTALKALTGRVDLPQEADAWRRAYEADPARSVATALRP